MSEDRIIDAIKQKLKEGISEKELSDYLTSAGYSLYDIDKILTQAKREAEGRKKSVFQEIISKKEFKKNKKYKTISTAKQDTSNNESSDKDNNGNEIQEINIILKLM